MSWNLIFLPFALYKTNKNVEAIIKKYKTIFENAFFDLFIILSERHIIYYKRGNSGKVLMLIFFLAKSMRLRCCVETEQKKNATSEIFVTKQGNNNNTNTIFSYDSTIANRSSSFRMAQQCLRLLHTIYNAKLKWREIEKSLLNIL